MYKKLSAKCFDYYSVINVGLFKFKFCGMINKILEIVQKK